MTNNVKNDFFFLCALSNEMEESVVPGVTGPLCGGTSKIQYKGKDGKLCLTITGLQIVFSAKEQNNSSAMHGKLSSLYNS